jgi:DNA-binding NtrC family response regulator
MFGVTVARDYFEASAIIKTRPPRVLITELRLAEYNGLQLVLRAKAAAPEMAAIVTTRAPDSVLAAEAQRMGATFVVLPTSNAEFLAAAQRTAFSMSIEEPIRPPFERRFHERRMQASAAQGIDRRSGDRRRNGSTRPSRFALIT